ncbi:cilia- and flagella-associated protein 45-like [Schistocerca piceifrons]|uniref:cilia- and flagella-associated protein 45-like n=1 Tax=Schistocerca piceifrons TaxID=274613 RepID=UPI001F5EDD9B|nr:cilia- and flagella-associated protein 45-like [Schistocerca piceifrons]
MGVTVEDDVCPKKEEGGQKENEDGAQAEQLDIPQPGVLKLEKMRIVTPDYVREITVPRAKSSPEAPLMHAGDFQRLRAQAKVLTLEERKALLDEKERMKEKLLSESQARKDQMKEWEQQRQQDRRLNDLERDARKRATTLLKHAFELRQESETEVQKANRLILSTRCHALRDAQVQSNIIRRREVEAEEARLDQMMEQERQRALRAEAERCQRQAERTRDHVSSLLTQIRQNEELRQLEAQKRADESRRINEAQMKLQLEELEALRKRTAEQQASRIKLAELNEQLLRSKKEALEEQRDADRKVEEYMRRKAEREAAVEEELRLQRLAREREIAQLRTMQERAQGLEAEQDEMKAQRAQDEVEREWRRKELEAARRKAKEEDDLKKARAEQMLDRRRTIALEIAREKREFERIVKAQREWQEEDERQDRMKKEEAIKHRQAVIKQIQEKEQERIRQRQELFKEIEILKEEEKRCERHIKETMMRKVRELRYGNPNFDSLTKLYLNKVLILVIYFRKDKLPEVYIKEVERQLKLVKE